MSTDQHNIELLVDILNPDRGVLDICTAHAISFADLIDYLKGPFFQSLADAARQLNHARTELLALEHEPNALLALIATTDTDEEHRPAHETMRKSASRVLTIARQKASAPHSAPADTTPARRAPTKQRTSVTSVPPAQSESTHTTTHTPPTHTESPTATADPCVQGQPASGTPETNAPPPRKTRAGAGGLHPSTPRCAANLRAQAGTTSPLPPTQPPPRQDTHTRAPPTAA